MIEKFTIYTRRLSEERALKKQLSIVGWPSSMSNIPLEELTSLLSRWNEAIRVRDIARDQFVASRY